MNKEIIKKWTKKVGIIIGSIIAIFLLYVVSVITYQKVYIPHHVESLYQEGLSNLQIADSIAEELATLGQHNVAIELLTKAAEQGFIKSQTKLALYLAGYKDDYEKSSYWYLQAALKGGTDAQCQLGINYIYGYGVRQDFSKAIYWIKKAANSKDRWAQYELGNLYLNGLAYYDLDYNHTNYWYVGNSTFTGLEVCTIKVPNNKLDEILSNPKEVFLISDLATAKYYWTLSAKQGCSSAKDALEKIYE